METKNKNYWSGVFQWSGEDANQPIIFIWPNVNAKVAIDSSIPITPQVYYISILNTINLADLYKLTPYPLTEMITNKNVV